MNARRACWALLVASLEACAGSGGDDGGAVALQDAGSLASSSTSGPPSSSESTESSSLVTSSSARVQPDSSSAVQSSSLPPSSSVDTRPDMVAPELVTFTITPREVDTSTASAVVVFAMDVSDDVRGVTGARVCLLEPATTDCQWLAETARLVSGSSNSGRFSVEHRVAHASPVGTYSVETVEVSDGAGNTRTLTRSELESAGFDATFLQSGIPVDTEPPVLTAVTVSPTSVSTDEGPAELTFFYTITDDVTGGVSTATCVAYPGRDGCDGQQLNLTRVSGTARAGVYSVPWTLERYSRRGEYALQLVHIADGAGHNAIFNSNALGQPGFNIRFMQDGLLEDIAVPVLQRFVISPSPVVLGADGATVTFSGDWVDDLAGVEFFSLCVFRTTPETCRYPLADTVLVSGSELAGTFQLAITLPADVETGTWTIDHVLGGDRAHNFIVMSTSELAAAGFPATFEVR